jgi:hypothetical protein
MLLHIARSVLSNPISNLMKLICFLKELPGVLLEWRVNRTGDPIIFRDWVGNRYWRYPGDEIRWNWKGKSVTDSNHVIRYILNNVIRGATCVDIGAHIGCMSVCLWSND